MTYTQTGNPSRPYERANPEKTIVAFDCDGTLIQHMLPTNRWDPERNITVIEFNRGYKARLEVVDMLKAYAKMPNVHILVWSYGGKAWATQVANDIGVFDLADEIDGKDAYGSLVAEGVRRVPHIYYDDNGIGAFGDVWIDVDPFNTQQIGSLGFPDWTLEDYIENPPCRYCNLIGCEKPQCVDLGEQPQFEKGNLRSLNDPVEPRHTLHTTFVKSNDDGIWTWDDIDKQGAMIV